MDIERTYIRNYLLYCCRSVRKSVQKAVNKQSAIPNGVEASCRSSRFPMGKSHTKKKTRKGERQTEFQTATRAQLSLLFAMMPQNSTLSGLSSSRSVFFFGNRAKRASAWRSGPCASCLCRQSFHLQNFHRRHPQSGLQKCFLNSCSETGGMPVPAKS